MKKTILDIARECIELEQKAIISLTKHLEKSFEECVNEIIIKGSRIVLTGLGKSAIVAQKIVATMNSTGSSAHFMHAVDALHGDISILSANDFLCCLSKSGETEEIKRLIPIVKEIGCKLIAITANKDSFLAKEADYIFYTPIEREADPNNLAPTASTAAQMAIGDALAICLMHQRGFKANDFAKYHPGGQLGKKLKLKVADLSKHHGKPINLASDSINQVILTISKNRLGATVILNESSRIEGIITDGDLRRMIEKNTSFEKLKAFDIMCLNPRTISAEALATEALNMMRINNISQLIVTHGDDYVGMIHLHDIIKEGLM
ncbi:MAG: KpsF/GutQ family sugar-phosphate isomerase [Saprospiraceae bacterium]